MVEKVISKTLIRNLLPQRTPDSHKYTYGRLFVWSGSLEYRGAPFFVGKAAYRAGVGLVEIACPEVIIPSIATMLPEAIFFPLSLTTNKTLFPNTIISLIQEINEKKVDATVIGPGLGMFSLSPKFIKEFLQKNTTPLLIDGDALTLLSNLDDSTELLRLYKHKIILTPHEGECARLVKTEARLIHKERQAFAEEFATKTHTIVVLKGMGTIITDGKETYINPTGQENLATAGTGDVLAGYIGSFLAQGCKPLDAALLGTYFHGLCGDLWKKKHGNRGMLASELADFLTKAFHEVGTS